MLALTASRKTKREHTERQLWKTDYECSTCLGSFPAYILLDQHLTHVLHPKLVGIQHMKLELDEFYDRAERHLSDRVGLVSTEYADACLLHHFTKIIKVSAELRTGHPQSVP